MSTSVIFFFNENPNGVFFAGQNVSGKIQLTTKRKKIIRGIYLKIIGYSKVEWEETTGSGESESRSTYTAKEEYALLRKQLLWKDSCDSFELQPGNYEFGFAFTIPTDSPSSFSGRYGETKYMAVCKFDRPWKFNNVFKHPFTVIYPVDLNDQPTYLLPVEREITKSFSEFLFFGHGGTMTIKVRSPCGGYVPGQSIPVAVSIRNDSNVTTSETFACLMQTIEYRATFPLTSSKYEQRLVTINHFGPLKKCKEKQFECNLYIPAVAPSSFATCKIIETSYNVEIQLTTRGLHKSILVKLPVTIATIPHRQPAEANESSGLPTYEEAVALGPCFPASSEKEDKHVQLVAYTPKYLLYNNLNNLKPTSDTFAFKNLEK